MQNNPGFRAACRLGVLLTLVFALVLFVRPPSVEAGNPASPACQACVAPCDQMERDCDAQLLANPNFDYADCIDQASECLNNCLCVCASC